MLSVIIVKDVFTILLGLRVHGRNSFAMVKPKNGLCMILYDARTISLSLRLRFGVFSGRIADLCIVFNVSVKMSDLVDVSLLRIMVDIMYFA